MCTNEKKILNQSIDWLKTICDETKYTSVVVKTIEYLNVNFDLSRIEPLIEHYQENFKINLFTAYCLIFIYCGKYPDEIWNNESIINFFEYQKTIKECQLLFDSLPIANALKSVNNEQINELHSGMRGSFVGALYNVSNMKNYNILEELTYAAIYKEKPGGNYHTTPSKWLKFIEDIYNKVYLAEDTIDKKSIVLKKWELQSVSKKGNSHNKCDDSATVVNFSDKSWGAYSADGLGSRVMSHIGSKFVGECFINCIKKMRRTFKFTFENEYSDKMMYYIQNCLAKDIARSWKKKVNQYIKSKKVNYEVDDFASTLLIAYGCEKFVVCGMIGDGNLIIEKKPVTASNEFGYTYMDDCFTDVIQKSALNVTHLIDNPNIMQFRFFNPKEISGIILASDGANAIKYKNVDNILYSNMNDLLNSSNIFSELRNLNNKKRLLYLEELCNKYSLGNKFGGGRGDDCSIVYIKSRR